MQTINRQDFVVYELGCDTYRVEWLPMDEPLWGEAIIEVDSTTTTCKGDGYITPDFSDTTIDGVNVITFGFGYHEAETGHERPVTDEEKKFILETLVNHLTETYL
jgi:hypothetical protein